MALYVRTLRPDEQAKLEALQKAEGDSELGKRVAIVLLSAQHRGVQEISMMVGLHPINVRKWIHRFNSMGLDGLYPRRSPGRPRLFSDRQRQEIVRLARTSPTALGLNFSNWSLQRLRQELIRRGIVSEISAEAIRQELRKGGLVFEGRTWVADRS
ncbi:MAG: helix-turn-helix domain-containing protein [Anaerolineae bacterium]